MTDPKAMLLTDERMTLIERLRNPAWVHGPDFEAEATLDKEQTIDDMREAADEIERLRTAAQSAVRERTIEECAKVADHYALVTIETTTAEKDEYARKRAAIVASAIRSLTQTGVKL